MNYPVVTVFTIIYNTNPSYVIDAIKSVRENNYPNLQHIIIDDFSSNPEPKNIVKSWLNENNYDYEFHQHEFNYGVCKTFNHALDLAKGKYIFFCSDDLIAKNKIITEVKILEDLDDSFAATYSDAYLINEKSESLDGMFIGKYRQFLKNPEGNIFNDLIEGNFLPAMSMMWKTEKIREIGGYDENLRFEDYDLHLRLFKKYKIKYIDVPLSSYRIHTDSLSNTIKDWTYDYYKIYNKHLDVPEFKQKLFELKKAVLINSSNLNDYRKYGIRYPILSKILKKIIVDSKSNKIRFDLTRFLI